MAGRLLRCGESELHLYADGSFHNELGVGAWAYEVPTFEIAGSGLNTGAHLEWFEFAGVVEGLKALLCVDASARPVRVHTDSEYVLRVLGHLAAGAKLPERRSFDRVRELYVRAAPLAQSRALTFTKCTMKRPEFRKCHDGAIGSLRQHLQNNLVLSQKLACARQERKRCCLLAERDQLLNRLHKIDAGLIIAEARIAALKSPL